MSSIGYDSRMRCMGGLQHLDATLASLAREETALRLRLGQLLEVIGRGAVFELGFSSLGAYAVERCERSARWAEAARCLARRLEDAAAAAPGDGHGEGLVEHGRAPGPRRDAGERGALARARAEPDGSADARAGDGGDDRRTRSGHERNGHERNGHERNGHDRTADGASTEEQSPTAGVGDIAHAEDDSLADLQSGGSDEICTLTCTVDREDAWLFEATRCLLEQLGVNGAVAQTDALLAEAQSTLLAVLPEGTLDLDCSARPRSGAAALGCSSSVAGATRPRPCARRTSSMICYRREPARGPQSGCSAWRSHHHSVSRRSNMPPARRSTSRYEL